MHPLEHATELIRHVEALRLRLDALDAVATGICAGMQLNTLGGEAVYQLLDMIAADLKGRADAMRRLLEATAAPAVTRPFSLGEVAQFGRMPWAATA